MKFIFTSFIVIFLHNSVLDAMESGAQFPEKATGETSLSTSSSQSLIFKDVFIPQRSFNTQAQKYEVKNELVDSILLNTPEPDIFSGESFEASIKEREQKGLPFIIAGIKTGVNQSRKTDYFDAYPFLSYMFGQNFISSSANRYTTAPDIFKGHPISKATIVGPIKLYFIDSMNDPAFTYLGSDYDLYANDNRKIKDSIKYFLIANNPAPTSNPADVAEANLSVGLMYIIGSGITKDLKKAKKYLEKAEEQSANSSVQALADAYLGMVYRTKIMQDDEKAKQYLEKAATQTINLEAHIKANFNLGQLYFKKKDYEKALPYLEQATAQTTIPALQIQANFNLGQVYRKKKDYEKALPSLEQAAAQTTNPVIQAKAIVALGQLYLDKQDYEKALPYWEKAATQTIDLAAQAKANYNLGLFYVKGLLTSPNYEKALFYFEKAAQQKNDQTAFINAHYQLGKLYFEDLKQPEKALEYLKGIVNLPEEGAALMHTIEQTLQGKQEQGPEPVLKRQKTEKTEE